MEVAGIIIGSISLLLSLSLGTIEIQRRVRYRKPQFRVESAEIPVDKEMGTGDKRYVSLGQGQLILNVRGSRDTIMFGHYESMFFRPDGSPLIAGEFVAHDSVLSGGA